MFNLIEASMIVQKQGLKKSNKAARKLVLVTIKLSLRLKLLASKNITTAALVIGFLLI